MAAQKAQKRQRVSNTGVAVYARSYPIILAICGTAIAVAGAHYASSKLSDLGLIALSLSMFSQILYMIWLYDLSKR